MTRRPQRIATLTTAELAERWGMATQTLRQWRSDHRGPAWFRPNGGDAGRVLYRLADIEAWERRNRNA